MIFASVVDERHIPLSIFLSQRAITDLLSFDIADPSVFETDI